MEAKYFKYFISNYLNEEDIYIFKVVSDHLDDKILSKEFIKQLIRESLKSITFVI
jgi:poly(3-hydroxyalkanoate) synthetase